MAWHSGESVYSIREREIPLERRHEAWETWKRNRHLPPNEPASWTQRGSALVVRKPPETTGFEPHEIQMGALLEEVEQLQKAIPAWITSASDEGQLALETLAKILNDNSISYRDRINAAGQIRLWMKLPELGAKRGRRRKSVPGRGF